MRHLQLIGKKPVQAESEFPVSDKINFVVAVVEAFKPLFVAKEDDSGF